MKRELYKKERERRGTQDAVAKLLGVHQTTIARRETGTVPITREAEMALMALPECDPLIAGGRGR